MHGVGKLLCLRREAKAGAMFLFEQAQDAKGKKPLSNGPKYMNEIRQTISKRKISADTESGIWFGVFATSGTLGFGSVIPAIFGGVNPLFTVATIGIWTASAVGMHKHEKKRVLYAMDKSRDYLDIKEGLNSEFLGHFQLIIINPQNIVTNGTRRHKLVEFLKHPYREYHAEKIDGDTYRFYFSQSFDGKKWNWIDNHVWADINVNTMQLVVRDAVIDLDEQKYAGYAQSVSGQYAKKPYDPKKENYKKK